MNRRNVLLISGAVIGVGVLMILVAFIMTGFQPKEFNTAESVSETYEIAEPFTGLDIHTISSDVRFVVAEDGKARIESSHESTVRETVDVADGILSLRQESAGSGIHFGIYYIEQDHVTVYLPQSEYETLFVETASGDVDAPAPFVFQLAKIKTSSGEIKCFAQSREELTLETVSGDIDAGGSTTLNVSASSTSGEITLANLTVADTLAVTTVSGDVALKASAADAARLKTTSGEIELTDARVAGKLSIHTVSGDVDFDRSDAGELEIQTTSGEVEGTLLTGKTFDVHTSSGEVRVPEDEPGAPLCSVQTTSGDVRLRVVT